MNKKFLKIFVPMIITIQALFLIIPSTSFAIAPKPIVNKPVNGSLIPNFDVYMKWFDVSGEDHYSFAVRDLTENLLVIPEISLPQNSTFACTNGYMIDAGHQYRWAVASVDSQGNKNWTESYFNIESSETHVASYKYSSASNLAFQIDDWGDSWYGDNVMGPGTIKWNGVTGQVNLNRNVYSDKLKISIDRSSNVNDLGATDIYYQNNVTTYAYTHVYYYNLRYWNRGWEDDKAVVGHEIGHALSLLHTADLSTAEIMDQGFNKSLETTDIDRTHLRIKWGWT
jgi:hypothetical protein